MVDFKDLLSTTFFLINISIFILLKQAYLLGYIFLSWRERSSTMIILQSRWDITTNW